MQTIFVNLPGREYSIYLGERLIQVATVQDTLRTAVAGRTCWIIADNRVASLYAEPLRRWLIQAGAVRVETTPFPAGEAAKNLATVESLYHVATAANLDRKTLVLALGGGVTGDLAGFVAASYLRGLRLIQVPTTLLALVDSSIGGKVGVDLPEGKNLVGAFHQPVLVLGELEFLRSLPEREWRCGLAEVVKYAVILDDNLFADLETMTEQIEKRQLEVLERVVARCCELKAAVVMADEKEESGRRAILNYGHTFGHALEMLGGYTAFNHGEAVAIGMGMAADLAVRLGQCPADVAIRQDRLLQRFGLPVRNTVVTAGPEAILAAMGRDKKTVAGKLRLILPRRLGAGELVAGIESAALLGAIGGRCG